MIRTYRARSWPLRHFGDHRLRGRFTAHIVIRPPDPGTAGTELVSVFVSLTHLREMVGLSESKTKSGESEVSSFSPIALSVIDDRRHH
jgi:hypothetical protein